MNIREHDSNRSFKAPDNVEKYLIRIIQRYFDIENNYTNESIESIIIESLTRLKRDFIAKKGFVFNINGKTGHLVLDISDFNGEFAFDKNTAFNKDFGTDPNTITEGNDARLSDERDPLPHIHVIGEIKELEDTLKQSCLPEVAHSHRNQSILDMLTYAGSRTEIDLVVIEQLSKKVSDYIDKLDVIHRGITLGHENDMKPLVTLLTSVRLHLENVHSLLVDLGGWVDEAKQYANTKVQDFAKYLDSLIARCFTEDDIQGFYDKYKGFTYIAEEGEIPIPDGEITLKAETSEDISAGDGDGGSLEVIYNDGEKLGNENWAWNPDTKSFVYQSNDSSYSVFLSPNVQQDYIHRVVLKSTNGDDDVISVILAYDQETNSHLSLLCHTGGLTNSATSNSNPSASIVKDFFKNSTAFRVNQVGSLYNEFNANRSGWNSLSNGIAVLIKRTGNVFKIWVIYNQPHNWTVIESGSRKDIITTTLPTFEFNLMDYPELHTFADKPCQYGYGCMSQSMSTYADVFYYAPVDVGGIGDIQGHTTIYRTSDISHTVSSNLASGRTKLFFRYDEEEIQNDGSVITKTVTVPFPVLMLKENRTVISIQGSYQQNGSFDLKVNIMHTVPDYLTDDNIYQNKEVIIVSSIQERLSLLLDSMKESEYPYSLCLISNQDKFDFIKRLLNNTCEYFFQAMYQLSDNDSYTWVADDLSPLTFFKWASGQPDTTGIMCAYLKKNSDWEMYSDHLYGGDERGYIVQYPIKNLSDYFTNPRIYYQIYGEKE